MSGYRVDRTRRSAKGTVTEMAESMLKRTNDENVNVKLDVLQTIAARMNWNDLFEKIKNRHWKKPNVLHGAGGNGHIEIVEMVERTEPEKWWQK